MDGFPFGFQLNYIFVMKLCSKCHENKFYFKVSQLDISIVMSNCY